MGRLIRAKALDAKVERRLRIVEDFASHRATLTIFTAQDGQEIERLEWRHPQSSFYAVEYISDGYTLTISGDIGDAIHRTYSRFDLARWATSDLYYFASKCVASPVGRRYREWDAAAALQAVRGMLAYWDAEDRWAFRRRGGYDALASREQWIAWLDDHGSDVFGPDCWEEADLGMVISRECEFHLIGLQLALTQLDVAAPSARGR